MIVKVLIAFAIMTGVGLSTGLAVAHNNPNPPNNTGYLKDQCKDGGWQSLGFRNQGQCVSYFASGGRAPGH